MNPVVVVILALVAIDAALLVLVFNYRGMNARLWSELSALRERLSRYEPAPTSVPHWSKLPVFAGDRE